MIIRGHSSKQLSQTHARLPRRPFALAMSLRTIQYHDAAACYLSIKPCFSKPCRAAVTPARRTPTQREHLCVTGITSLIAAGRAPSTANGLRALQAFPVHWRMRCRETEP